MAMNCFLDWAYGSSVDIRFESAGQHFDKGVVPMFGCPMKSSLKQVKHRHQMNCNAQYDGVDGVCVSLCLLFIYLHTAVTTTTTSVKQATVGLSKVIKRPSSWDEAKRNDEKTQTNKREQVEKNWGKNDSSEWEMKKETAHLRPVWLVGW